MNWLLSPPTVDDLNRLLRAWRFWVLGTILGALLGTAVYFLFPPDFRARATVLVDYNLEQNWPEETDRKLYYYLERESRKLEEIAWSDTVMETVAAVDGQVSVQELRAGKLLLGQPGEGGWHFWADDADPSRADNLAFAWAFAFTEVAQAAEPAAAGAEISVTLTQAENLPVTRKIALGSYVLGGTVIFLVFSVFGILFFGKGSNTQIE